MKNYGFKIKFKYYTHQLEIEALIEILSFAAGHLNSPFFNLT